MPAAFRAIGPVDTANAPGITVQIPDTVEPGDQLLIPWALNNAVGIAGAPDGWEVGAAANGGSCLLVVLKRIAVEGDAGSSVSLASATTTRNVARVVSYSGVSWVDVTSEGTGSNPGASVTTPANPVDSDAVEISIAAVRGGLTGSPSMTAPSGIEKRGDATGGPTAGSPLFGIGDNLTPVSSGSLGPRTWTASQNVSNAVGMTVHLAPTASVEEPSWSFWDGSTEHPLTLEGYWNGAALVQVTPLVVP